MDGLTSVSLTTNPWPRSRPRGVKADGLRYERALARKIPGALHGQWFEFFDHGGRGFASPDFIADYGPFLLVIECKLTDCDEARHQITHLYRPILEFYHRKPARGVVICKNLRRDSGNLCDSLSSAVKYADLCIPTLHWLGKGPI